MRGLQRHHLGLLAIQAIACALCVSTYSSFGPTWDEPEHLAAGLALLQHGTYPHDVQHPPLARLAIALGPQLAGIRAPETTTASGEQPGRDILYGSGRSARVLTLARLGALPFWMLLIAAVWLWAERWFGVAHAWLASAFAASTPALLGHAGLAALDVPGTAMCLIALYWGMRTAESGTTRHAALFGALAGLAIGTKLYAIPFLAVCGLVLLAFQASCLRRPRAAPAQQRSAPPQGAPDAGPPTARSLAQELAPWAARGAAAAGSAALALVLAYAGRFEWLDTPGSSVREAIEHALGRSGRLHDVACALAAHVPVPLALSKGVLGLQALERHNATGHLSYLLGHTGMTGWWYFYPLDLAIKTPLPLLALGLAGLALLLHRGWRERCWRTAAPPLCFLSLLLFCAGYSRINIGIRHVLILYPFLAIAAAHALLTAWRSRPEHICRGALCALLLGQWSVAWTAFPDYFPYFNALAGRHPERFVVDSDLDWGQDLPRLRQALARRDVHELQLAYRGTAAPWLEGLPPYTVLPPGSHATGWIAVSLLAEREERDGYAWLAAYEPVQRIGSSIDLYHVPAPIAAKPLRTGALALPAAALPAAPAP